MAVEQHFKRLSQENERKKREFEKNRIRRAKEVGREVKKKWLVAVKAYRILEEREKEKERALKSREQLSKILDHSTKVLGAQLANRRSRSRSRTPDAANGGFSTGNELTTDGGTTQGEEDEEQSSADSDEFMSTMFNN
ncbi:unnamed protein product [Ambrosiozyma monospora]|uniref:Unnamed protein product n=1 Tax=Ambrosiozyma monospora TaxID=43982 RepID=A0ACB5UB37_AMBMO|nr:unnamed protein product [Ambrosiozyma monospora]